MFCIGEIVFYILFIFDLLIMSFSHLSFFYHNFVVQTVKI